MGTFYWSTFQSLFTLTWVKKFSQYFYFYQSIFFKTNVKTKPPDALSQLQSDLESLFVSPDLTLLKSLLNSSVFIGFRI